MRVSPFVATPCYGGQLCSNYVVSVLRLQRACQAAGVDIEFHFRNGESLITRARNECAAAFLASSATHLVFIDADIGFEPAAAIRLLRSGHDVVAGAYPLKCDELRFPVDYEALGPVDEDGFATAPMVTTGFMCIARHVIEKISAARPDLHYQTDAGEGRYAMFEAQIDPESRRYLSEDYGFCRLWGGLGGSVHLDTTCVLTHQGRKVYTGNLRDELKRKKHDHNP